MHYKKNKRKNSIIGFYVAMGVCLLAVGIAAVASYSNVKKIPSQSSSQISSETPSSHNEANRSESSQPESEQSDSSDSETSSESSVSSHTESSSVESTVETVTSSLPAPSENASVPESTITEEVLTTWTSQFSLSMPVGGDVIKEYSADELVYSETMRDFRVHNGIDIAAAKGDTVHAVSSGIVIDLYEDDLLGNVVVIDHSGYQVSYCGLGSTALVHVGDSVKQGEDIGSVLDVPCEIIEPAHLHLEVKKDGVYIDPLSLLP